MIEVLGMGSPNVIKVILMLEEIGLPYRVLRIDVFGGEQDESQFRRLNPNAKVPVLVDAAEDSSAPIVVCESGAILIYLAEKARALLPSEPAERYATLQWLMWQMSGLGPTGGQSIHFNAVTKDDEYGRRRFSIEIERLLEVLDERLGESEWLGGSQYSIADIASFPWITTLHRFFPHTLNRTNVRRWYDGIASRPAAVRTEAVASALRANDRENLKRASPAMLDRYFGRARKPSSRAIGGQDTSAKPLELGDSKP